MTQCFSVKIGEYPIYSIQFHYQNGLKSPVLGTVQKKPFDWSVKGRVLRNIYLADECRGMLLGFSFQDALYDNTTPIVPIKYMDWNDVKPSGLEPARGLRTAIDDASNHNSRLVWPSEVNVAWEKAGLNVAGFCMLGDGSIALPLQKDGDSFGAGPNIDARGGNQGYLYTPLKEVFFHNVAGLSREEAEHLCHSNSWRLASIYEIQAAWQDLKLDVIAYGRIWDDRFVIPIQEKNGDIPSGVNIFTFNHGNQGFFYVLDLKT